MKSTPLTEKDTDGILFMPGSILVTEYTALWWELVSIEEYLVLI